MAPETLTHNAVVVLAELAAAAAAFLCVYFVARTVIDRALHLPGLSRGAAPAQTVRRWLRSGLFAGFGAAALAVGAVDGWLIYQGHPLWETTREWLRSLPPRFWADLGKGAAAVVGLAVATGVLLRLVRRGLGRAEAWAKAYQQITANDESIQGFFRALDRIVVAVAWLLLLGWAARVLGLPEAAAEAVFLVLRVFATITVGLLLLKGLDTVVDSLDALSSRHSSEANLLRYYARLRHLVPLFKRCLEYVVYLYIATLAAVQVEPIAPLAEYGHRAVRVIGIFFVARVVIELANLVVDEVLTPKGVGEPDEQRRQTFVPLLRSFLKYAIYFGAAVMILGELGINPTPILAGAGIVGLAVGLGAQNLINDVVSGFFILFENHYLVGDFVEIGEARGTVEAIDLRTTRIRNPNGQLHILRNGQIGEVVNFSKEYTHAVVEVGVAYESDLHKVHQVLEQVGVEMAAAEADVLAPTQVEGLQAFGASELLVRTVTRVRPGAHLTVSRALRRRIKDAFDREGIEIPYARRVLILKDGEGVERLTDAIAGRSPSPPAQGVQGPSETENGAAD